jgi:hypothetical protein
MLATVAVIARRSPSADGRGGRDAYSGLAENVLEPGNRARDRRRRDVELDRGATQELVETAGGVPRITLRQLVYFATAAENESALRVRKGFPER